MTALCVALRGHDTDAEIQPRGFLDGSCRVSSVSSRSKTSGCAVPRAKGLTHLFFPSSAERPQARERREATARQVCAHVYAVTGSSAGEFARLHHEYGFWGGESEDERHAAGYPPDRPHRRARPRRLTPAERNRARPVTRTSTGLRRRQRQPRPRRACATPAGTRRDRPRHRATPSTPGGKGLNQAVARRPGPEPTTSFVGAVGDDDAGRALLAQLDGDRRSTRSQVARSSRPTGRALITVDERRRERHRRRRRRQPRRAGRRLVAAPTSCSPSSRCRSPRSPQALAAGRAAGARTDAQPGAGHLAGAQPAARSSTSSCPTSTSSGCSVPWRPCSRPASVPSSPRSGPPGRASRRLTRCGAWRRSRCGRSTRQAPETPSAGCSRPAWPRVRTSRSRSAPRAAAGALATTRRGAVPSMPSAVEIEALLRRQ